MKRRIMTAIATNAGLTIPDNQYASAEPHNSRHGLGALIYFKVIFFC